MDKIYGAYVRVSHDQEYYEHSVICLNDVGDPNRTISDFEPMLSELRPRNPGGRLYRRKENGELWMLYPEIPAQHNSNYRESLCKSPVVLRAMGLGRRRGSKRST